VTYCAGYLQPGKVLTCSLMRWCLKVPF